MSFDNFRDALFNNEIPRAQFNHITIDKRVGSATTRSVNRLALNPTYLKMRVHDDLITVTPFDK